MAFPTGRRPRRTRLLLAVLLLLALTLTTIDYRAGNDGAFGAVRRGVHTVLGPAESGVTAVVRPIGDRLSGLVNGGKDRRRADRLAAQVEQLQRQLGQQQAVDRTWDELSRLRVLAGKGEFTIVPATVIAAGDASGFDWTVTINAGSSDGVVKDQTVINADGLVGAVLSTTSSTAVVRLACDPGSEVGARLEGSQALGLIKGGGPAHLSLQLYDTTEQVAVHQRLVTFGSGTYAGGVPVGEVRAVRPGLAGPAVDVRPYVDFGALDTVGIVVKKPINPGDRLLPPVPATAAAPAPSAAPVFPQPTAPSQAEPSSQPTPGQSVAAQPTPEQGLPSPSTDPSGVRAASGDTTAQGLPLPAAGAAGRPVAPAVASP